MPARLRMLPLLFIVPMLLLACTVRAVVAEDTEETASGEVTLQVLDYAGFQELVASHHGSVVVVDVWSTSCPPCLREFPGLVDLHEQYEGEVACISLNLDYTGARNRSPEDYRERVMTWLERFGATFENVIASEGPTPCSSSSIWWPRPVCTCTTPRVSWSPSSIMSASMGLKKNSRMKMSARSWPNWWGGSQAE